MLLGKASADDAEGLKWVALFPRGQWAHHSGNDFDFTPELAAEFVANWKAAGSPPLPITLHHVPDDLPVTEKREAAQAEGWIEDLRVGSGDIALEGAVRWTDSAKSLIKADKYRYLSPEWAMAHVDRRSGEVGGPWLYGAALLNDPFFHTMPRVAANNAAPGPKEQPMSLTKRLCASLKLAETTTDDELIAAVEKSQAALAEMSEKLKASASPEKLTALSERLDKLVAENKALGEKLAAQAEAKLKADVAALIDGAMRAGKAMTEQLKATVDKVARSLGLEEAEKLVASLPVVVQPGKEIGVGGKDKPSEAEALIALNAKRDELVKAGVDPATAMMRALEMNPDLARAEEQRMATLRR